MFVRWIPRSNKKGAYEFAYLCQSTRVSGKVKNETLCAIGKISGRPDKLDRELFWRDASKVLDELNLPLPERSKLDAALAQKVPRGKNLHGDANPCVEWYTPPIYIDMVREVLGEIDLDPASNVVAQSWIKAKRYFTEADDGLTQKWAGRIWCNPPYGRKVNLWLEKGIATYTREAEPIIFLLNRTGAAWYKTLRRQVTTICEVEKRISFVDATGKAQGSPRYYNDFLYLGSAPLKFKEVFEAIGDVSFPKD